MKVFLLYCRYIDGAYNEWENVESIYSDRQMAEYDMLILEENNKDEDTSYFIEEHSVIETKL